MNIVLIDRGQDRHPMLNLDAAIAQPLNLKRIVGRELNGLTSKHPQDECGYPVISKVIVEPEVLVRLNGIKTFVLLKRVGADLIAETNAAAFLPQIYQSPDS